jgi:hypothetical protein
MSQLSNPGLLGFFLCFFLIDFFQLYYLTLEYRAFNFVIFFYFLSMGLSQVTSELS